MRNFALEAKLPCMHSVEMEITGDVFYFCDKDEVYTNGVSYCRRKKCESYIRLIDKIAHEVKEILDEKEHY